MSSNAPYPLKHAGNRNPQFQSFEEEVMPSLSLTPMSTLHLQSLGEHLFPLWNSARLISRASLDGICFETECKPAVLLKRGFSISWSCTVAFHPAVLHPSPGSGDEGTPALSSPSTFCSSYLPILLPGCPVLQEMEKLRVVQHLLSWKHVISHRK